jgi:hypothetical protein
MTRTQKSNKSLKAAILGLVLFSAALMSACGANQNILRSGSERETQANSEQSERSSFISELESMHTAGFTSVYVVRRRDGRAVDADDVRIIKQLTTDTNRRVKTDDDRAILIGANFALSNEHLAALNDRFLVEDHSPAPTPETTANANTAK